MHKPKAQSAKAPSQQEIDAKQKQLEQRLQSHEQALKKLPQEELGNYYNMLREKGILTNENQIRLQNGSVIKVDRDRKISAQDEQEILKQLDPDLIRQLRVDDLFYQISNYIYLRSEEIQARDKARKELNLFKSQYKLELE